MLVDKAGRSVDGRMELGRYGLSEPLAYGGMATVFLAELRGPLGFHRPVAVKRLHPPYARDPQFVSMLLDEARLCAFVRHPNVVQVLDLVAHEGELWVVLEHVLGASLRELRSAESGPVPPSVACTIMRDVLLGLHAAHEARGGGGEHLGIVHRDVSPHNVLLGTDGIARVTDFGIARAAWRAQSTESGQLKGKLAYMSPEQLGAGPVDRRSDVYAASILLWELLTGDRLFLSTEPAELLAREAQVIEPPSGRRSDLPTTLDEVVLGGLRSDPSERFATAMDMVEALEQATRAAGTCFASRQQVAAWLQSQASDLIAEREATLHRPAAAGPARAAEEPVGAGATADEATYVGPPPTDQERRKRGATRLWPFGLVGLATTALVLLGSDGLQALLDHDAGPGTTGSASSSTAGSAREAPRADSQAPPPRDPPQPAASSAPSTRASAPLESAAAAPPAPATQSGPRPKPSKSATPPRAKECDPPFETDADGIKRFKEQCL